MFYIYIYIYTRVDPCIKCTNPLLRMNLETVTRNAITASDKRKRNTRDRKAT